MLDVRRMKVLREVAAQGSFSAAAEALSFTQSAVSQQVAALEREAGAKLVERGARGIRLTAAGQALVKHADAILARLDDAEQELAAIAGLKGGRLRTAAFQSAGATMVPRALAEFHRRHPEVDLSAITAELAEAHELLRAGEIEVAIVMDFEAQPLFYTDLETEHLLNDSYYVALPSGHPLADKARVNLADLADEDWINSCPGTSCDEIVMNACRSAGFSPRVVIQCDENDQMQAFVAGGLGVALWPQLALAHVRPGVAVKPVAGTQVHRRVHAATLAGAYRAPATDAMLAILRETAAEFETGGAPIAVAS
jgi:DNA-binding transcriptional LysR family regulator